LYCDEHTPIEGNLDQFEFEGGHDYPYKLFQQWWAAHDVIHQDFARIANEHLFASC
jgi:hypothetical protein